MSSAGGERGGHLPPRHPCHLLVKHGGSSLSRLGAASAHPQGLALMESRLQAVMFCPCFSSKLGRSGRTISTLPLDRLRDKHPVSVGCRSTPCLLTHKFCGGAKNSSISLQPYSTLPINITLFRDHIVIWSLIFFQPGSAKLHPSRG